MTNEQIIAGNKLIAKFMGGITAEENNNIVYKYQDIWLPIHGVCNWATTRNGMGKILHYHDSWDWLMPVVEKIEEVFWVECRSFLTSNPKGYRIFIGKYNDFTQPPIVNVFAETKINATYIAVIKFIHWYNENKK